MFELSTHTLLVLAFDIAGILTILFLAKKYCRKRRVSPFIWLMITMLSYLVLGALISYSVFVIGLRLSLPAVSIYISSAIGVLIGVDLMHAFLQLLMSHRQGAKKRRQK